MRTRLAGLILVNALLLLGYVWCRLQTYDIGYDISRTLESLDRAQEMNARLKLEHTSLTSPQRLRQVAEERLGLVPLAPSQRVIVEVPPPK
ncbi:MAG: cell division protein FtsL [Nitrospirae bacterium]|nr:cell division protein FtsL [Nitrospirota bacterium]